MRAPICSRSAPCCTRWQPGTLPFRGDSSGVIFKAILERDPVPRFGLILTCQPNWKRSLTSAWRKIATCDISMPPKFVPICNVMKRDTESGHRAMTVPEKSIRGGVAK